MLFNFTYTWDALQTTYLHQSPDGSTYYLSHISSVSVEEIVYKVVVYHVNVKFLYVRLPISFNLFENSQSQIK